MKFSLVAASLAGLAAAAPYTSQLVARADDLTQQILANITQTRNDLKRLNATLNESNDPNYQYNFFQLIAIQGESSDISNDLNSTVGTANASAVATSANSALVYDAVANGLKPDTFSILDNLQFHYPGFKAGGISGTVENILQSQRELSRQLGNTLSAKASPDYVARSNALGSQILARFDQAIAKFAN